MLDDERVCEELEALEAILMDEIKIKKDDRGRAIAVETEVHPWTALDPELQYVMVKLEVSLPKGYPDIKPKVSFSNPRGLEDSFLIKIMNEIDEKCDQNLGQPVIFEIIEIVKERLTASNMPSCPCCICLYGFRQGDHFTKTDCYHYFHSRCLAGHLSASENVFREEQDKLPPWQQTNVFQGTCPVCRAHIDYDIPSLKAAPQPQELEEAPSHFVATPELRSLQEKMAALYLHQQSKGGIIQEENRTILLTANTPTQQSNR